MHRPGCHVENRLSGVRIEQREQIGSYGADSAERERRPGPW